MLLLLAATRHTRQPCAHRIRRFGRWMANLWVLMRRSIVMLAWVIMAIVRLLPWRPGLRWWIDIPLALWPRRRSYRELLSLPVVCTVRRWWGVVRLRVGREVLRSGVVVVGCHVGDCVVVVVVAKFVPASVRVTDGIIYGR